ncbi:hypothetical protein C8J55DRAFT_503588 [Lentinula edodes]|uniref:Uncharacterized protein n=1 Tax=Lentinula lateritia TaxID=40482 RepID=A0A9W9DXG9_9AGAR|nr:hypothetical protein C8J55DRAFT_503588 [Lentinula edodes]
MMQSVLSNRWQKLAQIFSQLRSSSQSLPHTIFDPVMEPSGSIGKVLFERSAPTKGTISFSFIRMVMPLVGEEGGRELIKGSSHKPTLGRTHEPIIRPDELSAVSNIADYIVYFVTQIVGVSIDADAIYATVLNAFTNLEWASESGFADFSSSSTGTNSSWEYRITFSAPYSGSSNTFLSFVSTILLEADIKNRSS